jgi:hypothetical protein
MPWTYRQSTGEIDLDDNMIGTGYSGNGQGLDNPAMQDVPDVGPIPEGNYTIGPAFDSPAKGPCVHHLLPDPANQMFGRDGFLIHGDNSAMNHTASEGCIILTRDIRQRISDSGDTQLTVIA